MGVITAGSGNDGKPDEDPPPVNGDNDPSVVKLWGEISPYPDMADGVSPPPKGPKGGLLLNVVRDWDGVAFGESANYNMREQFDSRLKEANNIVNMNIWSKFLFLTLPKMLSFSRLNLRLLAANARNINNPNAKNAMTPTVIDDIVATKIKLSCN